MRSETAVQKAIGWKKGGHVRCPKSSECANVWTSVRWPSTWSVRRCGLFAPPDLCNIFHVRRSTANFLALCG